MEETTSKVQTVITGPSTGEELLTKAEVAKKLRKTVRTVDNWMRDGFIPYYKINRSVAFKWSEIEAELAAMFRKHGRH